MFSDFWSTPIISRRTWSEYLREERSGRALRGGRSRSWFQAFLTLESMKQQLIQLTSVTFTGLIAGSAGLTWNQPQEATSRQLGDWQRGTALLAAMVARRFMSREAAATTAATCAKRWELTLDVLAYFGLHGFGKVDGVLAGAVVNAVGVSYAWPEAVSLLGTLPWLASSCDPGICNILITACGAATEASRARALLTGMLAHGPRPDLISFNAFLAVAGQDWTSAISAFEQLRQLDLPPDRHEDVIL
ncbi:unnamed protein product [Symbiodinium pilosum]|uniref:Pentatricopeptide repeat-containing protein, chloroplastic n=1 Tax=Symbiodinium pilosum TaxID=2952 RepID=A0A812N3X1_SYMPI|nr:unnamed protein product [Symbiodinium pilosum]